MSTLESTSLTEHPISKQPVPSHLQGSSHSCIFIYTFLNILYLLLHLDVTDNFVGKCSQTSSPSKHHARGHGSSMHGECLRCFKSLSVLLTGVGEKAETAIEDVTEDMLKEDIYVYITETEHITVLDIPSTSVSVESENAPGVL